MKGVSGVDPRQMSMLMRKMGLETRDIDHVQEVIIRTRDREYRFVRPEVSVMKAQGVETWQVQGKVQTKELAPEAAKPAAPTPPAAPATIPDEDVRMVMEQTGKDAAAARKALEAAAGDIAEAIVRLS